MRWLLCFKILQKITILIKIHLLFLLKHELFLPLNYKCLKVIKYD